MVPTDTQTAQNKLDDIFKALYDWGTSRDDGTDGDAARPATDGAQASHREPEPEPAAATVAVP